MTTFGWALTALGCAAVPMLFVAHARHTTNDAEKSVAPPRNEGGGYEWPDGRITKDPDGLEPIDKR